MQASPPLQIVLFVRIALEDGLQFMSYAAQALSRDEFTRCFEPKPPPKPTNRLLYWCYLTGTIIRYGILFPIRFTTLLLMTAIFIACLPLCYLRPNFMRWVFRTYCRVWLFSFGAIIRYHGKKPSPDKPHLFVANHTSFIDYFLLSAHGTPHASVAQAHGGIFGWFQRYALRANGSLHFNRNEQRDRLAVAKRMQAHINKRPQLAPLIIFPEGTCVNNESTVLFHKGAFELDAIICPVAIKYNKRLLDPYWNTREQTFTQHALYLMTRWLMVADVWWLPPTRRGPEEGPIDFANRVKSLISVTAGLRDLSWDGYMKNCMRRKDQEKMLKSSQERYVTSLRRRLTPAPSEKLSGYLEGDKGFELDEEKTKLLSLPIQRRQRRTNSFTASSSNEAVMGGSLPTHLGINIPYLPAWLSDASLVEIKNELLMADSTPEETDTTPTSMVSQLRNSKNGIASTWRFYSRSTRRQSPHPPSEDQASSGRRMENSAWRFWYKQRLEDGLASPISKDQLLNSSTEDLPILDL